MMRSNCFHFQILPIRASQPEACGLRHLAFEVDRIEDNVNYLISVGIQVESIRVDPITSRKFTFFQDPDGLLLEIYEIQQ